MKPTPNSLSPVRAFATSPFVATIFLVFLIILAGCSGQTDPSESAQSNNPGTDAATPQPTEQAAAASDTSATTGTEMAGTTAAESTGAATTVAMPASTTPDAGSVSSLDDVLALESASASAVKVTTASSSPPKPASADVEEAPEPAATIAAASSPTPATDPFSELPESESPFEDADPFGDDGDSPFGNADPFANAESLFASAPASASPTGGAPASRPTVMSSDSAPKVTAVSAPAPSTGNIELVDASAGPSGLIWVEGEDADRSTARRHNWYDSVRKDELSGGNWISHFHGEPANLRYEVDVPDNGTYQFWIRANPTANPTLEIKLDDSDWATVDFSDAIQRTNIASDGKPDMRYVSWVKIGDVNLRAGKRTVEFRMTSKNNNHGGLDAFVFSKDPFLPNHALKPGEKSGNADRGKWAFEPSPDKFDERSLLDLSYLNHVPAGKHGFIKRSPDGNDFVDGAGNPIRFWAGTSYVFRNADVDEVARWGRFYAKRGLNLVRFHGNLSPKSGSRVEDVDRNALDDLWRYVAGMKQAGVYMTISPYWGSHTDFNPKWDVANPDHTNMTGLVFFDPKTQAAYKSWLRALFTEKNPYTGIALKDEPAVAIFQIQNEDSLLFWTAQRIKGEARQLLRQQYADWLKKKYGSLDRAKREWSGDSHNNDNFGAGEVGIYTVWHLTQDASGGKQKRLTDQLEFLGYTMHSFNKMIADYIRNDLGSPHLVNAGNWKTADDVKLMDVERYSYTATDIIGVNKYFGGTHKGERSGSAILKGDVYNSRSSLLNPRSIPVNAKQPLGHPFIVPESQWVPPNRFQSEGPLVVAAYQSLTGVDAFYWFTIGKGFESPFGKWQTSTPVQMGMFPAASLMFRNGYIAQGDPVIIENRPFDNIWSRGSTVIMENPGFDPNRDAGDLPVESNVKGGANPLAFLAGPVHVVHGGDPSESMAVDLSRFISANTVNSVTGQIALNHSDGILTVDAPKAQAAAGFLSKASPINLSDIALQVKNEYVAIYTVSMDDKALAESERILVQAATIARPFGYTEKPTRFKANDLNVEGFEITNLGSSPWNLETNDFSILIRNQQIRNAYKLDANGLPIERLPLVDRPDGKVLNFPEDALYVVLTR